MFDLRNILCIRCLCGEHFVFPSLWLPLTKIFSSNRCKKEVKIQHKLFSHHVLGFFAMQVCYF